jgi:hypothetical protein
VSDRQHEGLGPAAARLLAEERRAGVGLDAGVITVGEYGERELQLADQADAGMILRDLEAERAFRDGDRLLDAIIEGGPAPKTVLHVPRPSTDHVRVVAWEDGPLPEPKRDMEPERDYGPF